jgi:XRE family transcriptional regulator, regulator of sulfur utilization
VSALAERLGNVIRMHRDRRGLSQEALAALADVDRSFLGEVERGEASPSLETLVKIANALGERLSALISECESAGAK